ncbi:MAG: tripartite tricarboxylate transporter substrate binding protein [Betaproteobacteria bacterium]|nr:tripartite tricarboxylate transporter substrate binding protein [Betaproteobacteria bacterium]
MKSRGTLAQAFWIASTGAGILAALLSGNRRAMKFVRPILAVTALAVVTIIRAGPVVAQQNYPERAVTIVAPAAPGGLYSIFARLIGGRLEQRLGKPFIVENRPGASSIVGALSVIRSAPNGYTLMVANSTGMATNVTLHKALPYDPVNDFAPVALIARIPDMLVVNASLPVHSVADLVWLARSTKGGLSFGSAGSGTSQHLSGELLKARLGIEMTHIPYKGMAPAINDLVGGHIQILFSNIPVATPMLRAGKIRALGVTTAQRIEAAPDVPPLSDFGVKDFDATSWFMLVAPVKTPKEIIDKLYVELRDLTGDPQVREEYIKLGLMLVNSPSPDELKRFVQAEIARQGDLVKRAGLAGSE